MKKGIIFLFVVFNSICFAQKINIKFETVWDIGNKNEDKKEYLFKSPSQLIIDKKGNLYVTDYQSLKIRKYDKNGEFICYIGRDGSGPGEFKHIEWIYFNNLDQLVVKDQVNGRHSIFTAEGRIVETVQMDTVSRSFFRPALFDGKDIIGQVILNRGGGKPVHGNKFILYDKNYSKQLTSFGHTSIFWNYDTVMDLHEDGWCGLYNYMGPNNKFYVVRETYDGKLHIFDRGKNWEVKSCYGKKFSFPSFEVLEKSFDKSLLNDHVGSAMGFGEEWQGKHRVFTVFLRTKSIGLFPFKNKYIINFIVSMPTSKVSELGIDIYDLDGNYKGFQKIEISKPHIRDQVFAVDGEDNYYMKTNDGLVPIIKKIRLLITEN